MWHILRCYTSFGSERLRKTTKKTDHVQTVTYNMGPVEYGAGALTGAPQRTVRLLLVFKARNVR